MITALTRISIALTCEAADSLRMMRLDARTRSIGLALALTLTFAFAGTANAAGTDATRLFSPTSFWNQPLGRAAALDPASGRLVAVLGGQVADDEAASRGPWIDEIQYSTPLYTVGLHEPRVRVHLDHTDDPALRRAFSAVPIPANARAAAGQDQQMTVWQPSTDRLWEFWRMRKLADGWHADAGGAMDDVSKGPGYYTAKSWPGAKPWWGATGSRLPKIGGTILLSELASGHIDHAIAMNLPHPRAGVFSWPAQATDGIGSADDIPEGARFRLDPDLDIAAMHLPYLTRIMAEAAQKYGIVVRDQTGSNVNFFIQDPTPTGVDPFWNQNGTPRLHGPFQGKSPRELLALFPWSHLQLLQMTLCTKSPCVASPPTAPGALSVVSASDRGATLTWAPSRSSAGVAGYDVLRDGALVDRTRSLSLRLTPKDVCKRHRYTVRAIDVQGRSSLASQAAEILVGGVSRIGSRRICGRG